MNKEINKINITAENSIKKVEEGENLQKTQFGSETSKTNEALRAIEKAIEEAKDQIEFWNKKMNDVKIENVRAIAHHSELGNNPEFNDKFKITLDEIQGKIDGYTEELRKLETEELKR